MEKRLCALLLAIMLPAVLLPTAAAAQPAQTPHIVQTVYPTRDVVIADIVLTEAPYSADAAGRQDCAPVLQRAIDDCFAAGGGTVFLPAGQYRMCSGVTIRPFVTVRGDWQDPDVGNAYGTVIAADVESTDAETSALFTVGGSAGAVGLTVWYPHQSLENILPYPYTFYINGQGSNYMLQTIRDCTLLNAYRGIGACTAWKNGEYQCHEMLTIENVKGTCLAQGLSIYNSADVDVMKNVSISPKYWCAAGDAYHAPDAQTLRAYTKAHLTAFELGDLEWPEMSALRAEGCLYGVYFAVGPRASFSGTFFDLSLTDCAYGIYAEEDAIMHRGAQWGYAVCNGVIEGSRAAVIDNSKAVLMLTNVQVSGKIRGRNIHRETASTDVYTLDYARAYAKPAERLFAVEADRTGKADASAAVQTCLDAAGETGGIVYLPGGVYRFMHPVTVPAGVELRGAGSTAMRDQSGCSKGTLILADCGYADSAETAKGLISLSGDGAGLFGLRVSFMRNCPRDESGSYTATIPAVYGSGNDLHILYCGAILSSGGVRLEQCTRAYICGFVGCCYESMIALDGCTDAVVEGCLQNGTAICRNGYGALRLPELDHWLKEADVFTHVFIPITRQKTEYLTVRDSADVTIFHTFIYGGKRFLRAENSSIFVCGVGCDGSSKTDHTYTLSGGTVTVIGSLRSTADGKHGYLSYETDGKTRLKLYDRISVDLPYNEFTRLENIPLSDLTAKDLKTFLLQPLYAVYEWVGRWFTE